MQDNLKTLHETLTNANYDLPPLDRFRIDMSDDKNLAQLRETLIDHNWDMPDFETLQSDLGLKKKEESGLSESPSQPKESGSKSYLRFFENSIPQTHEASSTAINVGESLPEIEEVKEEKKKELFRVPTLEDVVDQASTPALYDALDSAQDHVTARPSQIIEREIETLSKSSPEVERRKELVEERGELYSIITSGTPDTHRMNRVFSGDGLDDAQKKRLSAINDEIRELNESISQQEDQIRQELRDAHKEREELFLEAKDTESDVVLKVEKLNERGLALTSIKESLEARQKAGLATEDEVEAYNQKLKEFQEEISGYEKSLSDMANNLERVAFLDKKIAHIDDDIRVNFTDDARLVGNSAMLGLLNSAESLGGWLQKSGVGKEDDLNALGRKIVGEKVVEWTKRVSEPYQQYTAPTLEALGDFDWSHFGDARFWKTNAPMMIASSAPYMVTGHIGGIAGKLIAPRIIAGMKWGQLGSKAANWTKFLAPGIIGSATSTPVMAMSYGGQTYLQALDLMKEKAGVDTATPEMEEEAAKGAQRTFNEVFVQGMLTNTLQIGLMYGKLPWNRFLASQNKYMVGAGRNAVIIGEQGGEEWFQEYRTYRHGTNYGGGEAAPFNDWRKEPVGKMVFAGGAIGGAFHAGMAATGRTVVDAITGNDVNKRRYIEYLKHLGTADFALRGDDQSTHFEIDRLIEAGEFQESDRALVVEDIEALRNDPVFQRAGHGYMGLEISALVKRQREIRKADEQYQGKAAEERIAEIEAEKVKIADAAEVAGIDLVQQGNVLVAYKDGEALPISDMNPEQKDYYDLANSYFNKRQQDMSDTSPAFKVKGVSYDNIKDFQKAIEAIETVDELLNADPVISADEKTQAKGIEIYTKKRTELGLDTEVRTEGGEEVRAEGGQEGGQDSAQEGGQDSAQEVRTEGDQDVVSETEVRSEEGEEVSSKKEPTKAAKPQTKTEPVKKGTPRLGEERPGERVEALSRRLKTDPEKTVNQPIMVDDQEVGEVFVVKGDDWMVRKVDVDPDQQEQGYAKKIYRDLHRQAQKEGKVLVSDKPNMLTKAGKALWESLVRDGDAIRNDDGTYQMQKKGSGKITKGMGAMLSDLVSKIDGVIRTEGEIAQEDLFLFVKENEADLRRALKGKDVTKLLKRLAEPKGKAATRKMAEELKAMIEESTRVTQAIPRTQSLINDLKALTRGEPNIEAVREGLTEFIKNNREDLNTLFTKRAVSDLLSRAENMQNIVDADQAIASLETAVADAEMVYNIAEESRSTIKNIREAIEAGRRVGKKEQSKEDRAEVAEIRGQLQEFIDENRSVLMDVRGRSAMALIRKVNQADTIGKLEAAVNYMDKLINDINFARAESAKEKVRDDINKLLRDKNFVKVEAGRLKAKGVDYKAYQLVLKLRELIESGADQTKVQEEAQKMLDEIEESRKSMPKERGDEMQYRDYTDEEITAIELLSAFNTENTQTIEGLRNIRDAIGSFIKNEKSKFRQKQEQLRDENKRLKEKFWTYIASEKNKAFSESDVQREIARIERQAEKEERDLTQEEQDRIEYLVSNTRGKRNSRTLPFKSAAQWVGNLRNAHWWSLLDMLSRNSESMGRIYQTPLHELLGEPVMNSEQAYEKLFTRVVKMMQDGMMEVFQFRGKNARMDYMERTKETHQISYNLKGKTITSDINLQQAAYLYMQFQDPDNQATIDKHYPEARRKAIMDFLDTDPLMKKWADYQLNVLYPKMHEIFNPYHVEYFGRDMPLREFYSPAFRDVDGDPDQFNAFEKRSIYATANHRSTKMRTRTDTDFKWMEADMVLADYSEKMAYWAAWHPTIGKLNLVFKNTNTTDLITAEFGQQYNEVIHNFIDDFARMRKDPSRFTPLIDNLRSRVYPATLGLKPVIAIKQLTSIPAYASFIPTGQFAKGMYNFWRNPKKNWNLLMESEFMKARYRRGWDRDLLLDMKRSYEKMVSNKTNLLRDTAMQAVKYGDRYAIIFGGFSVYDYHYRQNKNLGHDKAHKIALRQFEYATRLSQQASNTADLSYWQRNSSFSKMLTMYMNAPMLYHRTVAAAARRMKSDPVYAAKVIFINHVLLPSIFQFVGNGFDWHEKDQIQAAVIGNLNTLFLAGQLGEWLFEKVIGNTKGGLSSGPEFSSYTSHISQLNRTREEVVKLLKKWNDGIHDISIWEIGEVLNEVAYNVAPFAGVPYPAVSNMGKAAWDISNESYDSFGEATMKMFGWSDWAIDRGENVSVLWDKHERILSKLPDGIKQHYDQFQDVDEYLFIREMEKQQEDETYTEIRQILNSAEGREMTAEEQDRLERLQNNYEPWRSGEMTKEAKLYLAYHHYDISDKKVREDLEVLLAGGNNETKSEYMREVWKKRFNSNSGAFQLFFIDVYRDDLGGYTNEKGETTTISPVITDQLLQKYQEMWE